MTKLLLGQDEAVAAFVRSRMPHVIGGEFGPCRTIGFVVNGELVGGVVYNFYDAHTGNVFASIAADTPRWATAGTVRAIMDYPFNQLKCGRITCLVARKNRKSRKLAEGLGFQLEGNMRRGYGKDDALIYGLLRREAERWLS